MSRSPGAGINTRTGPDAGVDCLGSRAPVADVRGESRAQATSTAARVDSPQPPNLPSLHRSRRRWPRSAHVPLLVLLVDLLMPTLIVLARPQQWVAGLVLGAGIVAVARWVGLYRRRFHLSVLDEMPWLVVMVAAGVGAATAISLLFEQPRPMDLGLITLTLLVVVLGRGAVYGAHRGWQARDPRRQTRVLVIGADDRAVELVERIESRPGQGVALVGALVYGESVTEDLPVLGGLDDLSEVIRHRRVDAVVLTDASAPEPRLAHHLRRLPSGLQVFTVPAGYSLRLHGGGVPDQIWGIPVLSVTPSRLSGPAWWVKRGFDVVAAATALVVLAPVMLAVALAVRLGVGRNVVFRQRRVGREGREFVIYKFTSMRPESSRESAQRWNIADDDRVGPVGRFIRATSLDELPQLVNIVRGDMSIVGPRPERPYFVEQYSGIHPGYGDRHRVPVGLTGHAAVNGLRGDTSISERAHFDNSYIDNWSVWEDVKIILRTMRSVLGRHGR